MNHPFDIFRVFQHWAWAEHVVVERHVIMVSHKERTLQAFQQRFFSDVRIGIVDKDARIHITVGIDVKIPFSAGNAAFYKFRVILEIHGEKRLRCPVLPDPPAKKHRIVSCVPKISQQIIYVNFFYYEFVLLTKKNRRF